MLDSRDYDGVKIVVGELPLLFFGPCETFFVRADQVVDELLFFGGKESGGVDILSFHAFFGVS